MRQIGKLAGLGLALLPLGTLAQTRTWEAAISGGAAANFRTPLRINQNDAPGIKLNARYRTEPFNPPVYYDVRVGTWQNTKGWALKMTHHKIILNNRPPEVQRFSITDGFNLLTVSRLWQKYGLIWSVGGGAVITHPESTVRGQAFPERGGLLGTGYFLSGPTVEAAVAKRYYVAKRWFVLGEGRVTASYVRVPIRNGHAQVTNAAVHGLLGVGFQLTPAYPAAE